MSDGCEQVIFDGQLLAIIIYDRFRDAGVHFLTPPELSQQVAYMSHPKGRVIDAHVHNPVPREVVFTQEALFIKNGKLRVDFYNESKDYLDSRILADGDVVLLVSGGHGFEVLEDLRMIEVKQGPYTSDEDKERFKGVSPVEVIVRNYDHE